MSKSSFFEFHVAVSGIMTSRAALETVAHNTANASTRGYSRQVANMRATRPLQLYNGRGMIGTGSEVFSITQIRDVYLDQKYWGANGTLGEYNSKFSQMTLLETIFQEIEGTGLTQHFNDLFDSLEDLMTNAGDPTFRNNVVMNADSLATFFKDTYEAFRKQQQDINQEVKAVVSTVNSLGTQIQTLNDKIRIAEATGDNANDLRDQRAVLVDELSKYVNVTAYEEDYGPGDKRYFVKINGQDFVMNNRLNQLYCKEREFVQDDNGTPLDPRDDDMNRAYRNPEDMPGLYDIFWGNPNGPHSQADPMFDIYDPNLTGQLKGLIDVRDGNNGNFPKGIDSHVYATGSPPTLTIPVGDVSRPDIAESGGYISYTNSTGQTIEVQYKDYQIVGGNYVFNLAGNTATLDKAFAGGGGSVAIGKTSDYKGIPYYLSRLNDLARTFVTALNFGVDMNGDPLAGMTGHVDGFNNDGTQGTPPTLFFTYINDDGEEVLWQAGDPRTWDDQNWTSADDADDTIWNIYKLTAGNFCINTNLEEDVSLMNTAETSTGGIDDNREVIDSMIRLFSDDNLFAEGGLYDFVAGMTSELGIDVKQAENFEVNYSSLSMQVDTQRMSVSGVSINEEMLNMIKFNQQFQASSKLLNVIDGIYDTMINRLGLT